MITLKEQQERNQAIIQEAIRDSDLDKLDATFRQIDSMLDGLSPEGQRALAQIDGAIESAQQSIQKVAARSGPAIPSPTVSKTISQLMLLQSTLVQVFQQMPKIMNVVKRGLSKHLTRSPYEGVKESITLRGNYLAENYQNMSLRDVLLLLEKKREEESPAFVYIRPLHEKREGEAGAPEEEPDPLSKKGISIQRLADELHIEKSEVMDVMRELGMNTQIGGRSAIQPEDAQRIFVALTSADPQTGEEPEVAIEDPKKKEQMGQKIVQIAQQGEEGAEEPGELGPDTTIKDLLGDAAERAEALIASAMQPKGFFSKLKAAIGGEGLPFGLNAGVLAGAFLDLPFKDFTRLVDNAAAIKIQMDADAAKEIAQTTEETPPRETGAAPEGRRFSVSALSSALDKRGIRGGQKESMLKFFKSLVGRGPIEFSE